MKTKKIALITAFSLALVGLVLIAAAIAAVGFDFSRLSSVQFKDKSYSITESFQHIEIYGAEADIQFAPAENGQCRITSRDSEKILSEVKVENDTLIITRKDMRRWYESIGIWFDSGCTITVYLPETTYESLNLKTASGNIAVSDRFAFGDVSLSSISGNINFAALTSKCLSAKSTSGKVQLQNVGGGSVTVATTSGNLVVKNSTADSLALKTTSGEVTLSSVTLSNHAALEAVSGDIVLEYSDAGSFTIKTISGNVTASLLSAKNYTFSTVSGHIHLPPSDPTAGQCSITTTSGNVEIEIIS